MRHKYKLRKFLYSDGVKCVKVTFKCLYIFTKLGNILHPFIKHWTIKFIQETEFHISQKLM